MRPRTRRRTIAIAVACAIASSVVGCSKPVDPGSSVPSVYQPLVFVVAAVGIGILITSHNHKGGGGGPRPPAVTPPDLVGALGNAPFDIALDFSSSGNGGIGALGTAGGGGSYGFVENLSFSGGDDGSYRLPAGYKPLAVGIDGNGDDWFVDSGGNVKSCPPPAAAVSVCTPAVTLTDGLGSAGTRSITADSARIFIAQDDRAGTVSWASFALDGTGKTTGTYSYSPGLGMYNADAAMPTLGTSGIYTIFHKDGTSWRITVPTSTKNPFTFSPAPLPNQNVASDGAGNNYGVLGSPSAGSYQLGHYVSPTNTSAAPGTLVSTITIAFNGQTGVSPSGGLSFLPPIASLHTDGTFLYMLDSSGNLVLFRVF